MQSVKCSNCKNYEGEYKCKAFNFIIKEIFTGLKAHDKPIKGQKGDFVFEPVK